jgi:large subunit ribosomal protein L4
MARLSVLNQNGEEVSKVNLKKEIFEVEVNDQAIFDAVQVYLSNRRQATAKTKTRDEVSGGGKKPWRQKGTGRARQGSTRSPQWRGGGTVFGPDGNQNYTIKMNRKERRLALKSALTSVVKEGNLVVVDSIKLEKKSTKEMVKVIENLKLSGKVLFVIDEEGINEDAYCSVLNLQNVDVLYYDEINTYEILNHNKVVFTKEALKVVEEVLA